MIVTVKRNSFTIIIKKYFLLALTISLLISPFVTITTKSYIFNTTPPPIIINSSINPMKVRPGDNMIVKVSAVDLYGIKNVQARFYHEKGSDLLNLEHFSGNEYNGIWIGEWKVHDTKIKKYSTIITAYSNSGLKSSKKIEWWDPEPIPWWNDNWNYRKIHTINGSLDGSLTDYTIKFVTHKTVGSDNGPNVYLGSNVRDDFGDVRFINESGVELLYTLDFLNNGQNATFWVKIPYISVSPNSVNISIYYDNPIAGHNSDIKNTFPQAIDFSTDSIVSYGGSQDSDGNGEWTTDSIDNFIRFGLGSYNANNWKAVNVGDLNIISGDYSLCFWYKSDSNEAEICGIGHDTEINSIENGKTYPCDGTQSWGIAGSTAYNRGTGGWQYIENILNDYTGSHTFITIVHDNDGSSITDDFFKNIRVRKYTNNEPLHGFWGDEEIVSPTKPILQNPQNQSSTNDRTPTMSWTIGDNAENHTLLVDNETDFSDGDEFINITLNSTTDSYTIQNFEMLSEEGIWYWKVVANNSHSSNSSDIWNFIYDDTAPLIVNLISPSNDSSTDSNTVLFNWNSALDNTINTSDVSDIDYYNLIIDDDMDFSSPLINDNTSNTYITKTVSGQLYWRVRAVDNAGNNGSFSETRYITVFSYSLNADTSTIQIKKGTDGVIILNLSLNFGESENVSLSSTWTGDNIPSGINVGFSNSADMVSFDSITTFSISELATTGTFNCQISSISTSGINRSIDIEVIIYNMLFSLDGFPRSLSMIRSDYDNVTISVNFDQGSLNTVTLSGGWIGTTPSGVTTTITPASGTPNFDSKIAFATSKSASSGSFVYRVTGNSAGLTKTVNIYLDIYKNMSITVDTSKETYEKGQEINIFGEAFDPNGNLVDDGTVIVNISTQNWSYTFSTDITNGNYDTGYYISFDKPSGEWIIKVTATDDKGHVTSGQQTKDISVITPENFEQYTIKILSPIGGEVFRRGETIDFMLSFLNRQNEKIRDGEIKGFLPSGEVLVFSESSPGIYSYNYDIEYDYPIDFSTIVIEGKKMENGKILVGFDLIDFKITETNFDIELIDITPSDLAEIGENIEIRLKLQYPDGNPVSNAIVSAYGINGENINFRKSNSEPGRYYVYYTPDGKRIGNWVIQVQAEDAFGNYQMTNVKYLEIVETKFMTYFIRYWYVSFIIISLISLIIIFFSRKKMEEMKLSTIKKELIELNKLKKNNAILYFSKCSIDRDTYERHLKNYESKIANLNKKSRLLEKKRLKEKR